MDRYLEFAGNHPFLLLALTVSFFLLIFSELRRKASGLINLEATEAVKLINNDAAVIDLRSADAHGRGHIVNAKSVPFDELPAKMEVLSKNKDKPLIAVCDAGITTNKAVKTLREAGFASAYGLKGGMAAWTQEGLPVVTGKKNEKQKEMSDEQKVIMYGNEACPYCGAARMLLKKKGVEYTDISITADNSRRQEMIERSGRTSVPQIFIGETHVGGFDDLYALDKSGELDTMLAGNQ